MRTLRVLATLTLTLLLAGCFAIPATTAMMTSGGYFVAQATYGVALLAAHHSSESEKEKNNLQASSVPSAGFTAAAPQSSAQTEPFAARLDPAIPRVPGNELNIGSKAIALGDGEWIQLDKRDSVVQGSTMPSSISASRLQIMAETVEASTLTIAEACGTDLGRVVAMSANTSQARSLQNWNVELCKVPGAQFSERLTKGFDLPECLYVRRLASPLSSGSEMTAATYWATSLGLKVPPVYFEVGYAKYAPSGFLALTVFLPNTFVRDEAAALAWGRDLASLMQPLADGELPRAYLPGMQ